MEKKNGRLPIAMDDDLVMRLGLDNEWLGGHFKVDVQNPGQALE